MYGTVFGTFAFTLTLWTFALVFLSNKHLDPVKLCLFPPNNSVVYFVHPLALENVDDQHLHVE